MNTLNRRHLWWAFTVATLAFGASSLSTARADDEHESWLADGLGAVFTQSNEAAGNRVLVFRRAANGMVESAGDVSTGGLGSGASLGSQGSVTLSKDRRFLLVVNAGSNEVSSFHVQGTHLRLVSKVPSGGNMPTSVAERGHLVYVLNAGPDSNITGFYLDLVGGLHQIRGSTRGLSASNPSAAQVAIAPLGLGVVVTEKGTNLIDVFPLRFDGTLRAPQLHASSAAVPYGFDISARGTLVVSEAAGSSVSSYSLRRGFTTLSASVADNQSAACWLVLAEDGRYAYTANAGSSSISGYAVSPDGSLRLLDPSGVTASTGEGSKPLDLAIDGDDHLYVVDAGNHGIEGFAIGPGGALSAVNAVSGLPSTLVGLAAM